MTRLQLTLASTLSRPQPFVGYYKQRQNRKRWTLQDRKHQRRLSKEFRIDRVKHYVKASFQEATEADTSKATVVDYYILGRSKDSVTEERVRSVQESLWSLQYSVPGVVTSFIGSLSTCKARDGSFFDFAVVYRFSNGNALQDFCKSEEFVNRWETAFLEICQDHLTFTIQQHVDKQLEAIFRRGPAFEEGYDYLLMTKLINKQKAEEAVQFLSVLCDVACASETGAVSASMGSIQDISEPRLSGDLLVMASHLSDKQGVATLEAAPPIQQLRDDSGNGLLRAEFDFSIELATTEKKGDD